MDLKLLSKPFREEDYEYRLQSCGTKKNGDIWAMYLTYVTNRAIMDRLDTVCGPEKWKNEFKQGPDGGVLCGISIYVHNGTSYEWITKWDGAENTQVEEVKGGLSSSMKRAAVQWGIGRHLYNLTENFADITPKGKYKGRTKDKQNFKWNQQPN